MCVIICCEVDYPKLETLELAEQFNSHGGGIAWINGNRVEYKKGLTAKQIHNITKKIKLPFIIHFRIASVGEIVKPLCHPFPVDGTASTNLSGKSKEVLFHNGTWSGWETGLLKTLYNNRKIMPRGHWSDSRAMAYIAKYQGHEGLSQVDDYNKIAILNIDGIKRLGDGWLEHEGHHVSNDHFVARPFSIATWKNFEYIGNPTGSDDIYTRIDDDDRTILYGMGYDKDEIDNIAATLEREYQPGWIGAKELKRLCGPPKSAMVPSGAPINMETDQDTFVDMLRQEGYHDQEIADICDIIDDMNLVGPTLADVKHVYGIPRGYIAE